MTYAAAGQQLDADLAKLDGRIAAVESGLATVDAKADTNARDIKKLGDEIASLQAAVAQLLGADIPSDPEPPTPEPEPEPPVRPVDPGTQPSAVEHGDVQRELDRGGRVEIPGGTTIVGGYGLAMRDGNELVGTGEEWVDIRPTEEQYAHGSSAIRNGTVNFDHMLIHGIRMVAPTDENGDPVLRSDAAGIDIRLIGQPGQRGNVTISRFRCDGYDAGVMLVDDWSRREFNGGKGNLPGRLRATLSDLTCVNTWGSDSHAIPVYTEGMAEGCTAERIVCHRVGYTGRRSDGSWLDPPEPRAHGWYHQSLGAPWGSLTQFVMSDCGANAVQFRSGILDLGWGIMSRCAVGPYIDDLVPGSVMHDLVLEDLVDIIDRPGLDKHDRGKGYLSGGIDQARDCIAIRKLGSLRNAAAFELPNTGKHKNLTAVAWADNGLNFKVGDRRFENDGTLRTIKEDPGAPTLNVMPYLQRGRSSDWIDVRPHIGAVRAAIGLGEPSV